MTTVADDLDPAAVERATEVLTTHQRRDSASCLCGWSRLGHSFAQHQADMLAAAGLLVTPDRPGDVVTSDWDTWVAEHDAQVAARALRDAKGAIVRTLGVNPRYPATEILDARADRVERQEGRR